MIKLKVALLWIRIGREATRARLKREAAEAAEQSPLTTLLPLTSYFSAPTSAKTAEPSPITKLLDWFSDRRSRAADEDRLHEESSIRGDLATRLVSA